MTAQEDVQRAERLADWLDEFADENGDRIAPVTNLDADSLHVAARTLRELAQRLVEREDAPMLRWPVIAKEQQS